MKALLVCLLMAVVCSFSACEKGINLGDQGVACYEWNCIRYNFNIHDGTLELTNNMGEAQDNRILQYYEGAHEWGNIQGHPGDHLVLVGTTQNGEHSHVFYRVPYEEGLEFQLCVKKQGGEWKTIIIRLVPESGIQGAMLLVVELEPSALTVQPPSMEELDLQLLSQ